MNDLKNLPFDLYTRNAIIQRFVDSIRNKESLQILDVGGRNGQLEIFLPKDEINTLDLLPQDLKHTIYFQGDIRNPPFKKNVFDIVVSDDFFEHIPDGDRKQTLEKMMMLSKNYIILGAPFFSPEVAEAEIKANEYFFNIKGEPHPWLKEHIKYGLPSSEIFEQTLVDFGYDFLVVHSNNLSNWLLMQLFIFSAYLHGIPEENLNEIYHFYNTHYLTLGDTIEPTYRRIYLIGKKGTLPKVAFGNYQLSVIDPQHVQGLLSRIFTALNGIVQRKDTHIGNLQSAIHSFNLDIQNRELDLKNKQELLQQKDAQIHNFQSTIDSLNFDIQNRNLELSRFKELITIESGVIEKFNKSFEKLPDLVKTGNIDLEPAQILFKENESSIDQLDRIFKFFYTHLTTNQLLLSKLDSIQQETDNLNKTVCIQSQTLEQKDKEIELLTSSLNSIQQETDNLNKTVCIQSQTLEQKDKEIELLTSSLNSIYMSTSWAFFEKFQRLADLIFPPGTRRRSIYDLGVNGTRIIIHEGWQAFGFKIKVLFLRRTMYNKESSPVLSTNVIGMSDTFPLSLEKTLSGVFIFPADQLTEIQFLTATYFRKNSPLTLKLREKSPDYPILRTVTVSSYAILDNKYTSFKFVPIENSKGKKYYFEVQSQGLPAAAVWFNPSTISRSLQLLDTQGPIKGLVSFQVFSQMKAMNPYERWIIKNEPDEVSEKDLIDDCATFTYRPKISIVTPVWNTDEKWIRLAIESVINQIYDNWELCLVDGGSTKSHIKRVLNEYAQRDPRIKVKILEKNKGIAGNSNEALELATGDYVGFLDHDDELVPFALYEVVKILNRYPDTLYIYSDEDKIDEQNRRMDPFFKPDWSPDLFLSCNYLCHFSIVRKKILNDLGGFQQGYDGSQDYDLFLRITEKIKDNEIFHIPKILYHWRVIPESAAASTIAKPYAYIAAKKALSDSMARRKIKIDGVLDGYWTGSYRIKYSIPTNPKISIIIPTKDNVKILKQCIQSILDKTTYLNYEIIIVDNLSVNDETVNYYNSINNNNKIKILYYEKQFNFSAINNFAVKIVDSPYVLFLNNDTEIITVDWLSAMLEHAQRTNVGAVGGLLIYPNNTIQHAGLIIGNPFIAINSHKHMPSAHHGYFGRAKQVGNVMAVTAACMMMRKEIFTEIGGFDQDLSVAYNDVDLCLRMKDKGYQIIYTPFAQLYHYESLSRGYENTPEKQKRFQQEVNYIRKKWGNVIDKGDPYYNENLTTESEDFSIK
jgi:O-antigen biosynthesis protein